MGKANRETIHLVSSEGTGFFYSFRKKKGKGKGKLNLNKYDPVKRKHVLFQEKKLSKAKRSGAAEGASDSAEASS